MVGEGRGRARGLRGRHRTTPDCLGTGKTDSPPGSTPLNCVTCGGSGLQLSGASKRKHTAAARAKEAAKWYETGAIKVPPGSKLTLEGPIKGRSETLVIIDDPMMDRKVAEDAIGVLSEFKKRSKMDIPTDFLEDLFGAAHPSAGLTGRDRCLECGSDVRPYRAEDHANDCGLVKMKKCRVCDAEMGLCFKVKSGRAWICRPCARAKHGSRR